MQVFYYNIESPQTTLLELEKQDSRHLTKVLRKKNGDRFHITDGKGNLYEATLGLVTSNRCEIDLAFAKAEPQQKPSLHIAIAPTKMNDRMEWFLEKATEIGISTITPIICQRSERKKINHERFERILISAMQQSAQLWLPRLRQKETLFQFLENQNAELKFIAHCMDADQKFYADLIDSNRDTILLIGPEGDFTSQEVEEAVSKNYEPVSLGSNRLRTETAGVYGATVFQALQRKQD
ncbi:MAG: 16S rRNA (uracil(1498)-N(3))-methyltransferase [Nonlabens sp.]